MTIPLGLYRHYKGADYQVLQVVTHSETQEQLVLYRCLYGDYSWWVRPLAMFTETLDFAGEFRARFQFVSAMTQAELAAYPSLPWAVA